MYINGFFMLVFDLTPDLAASEGHASDSAHGHISLDLKFRKALPDPLVYLLYLEYDDSIIVDALRSPQISDGHRTDHLFSEERQIISGRLFVRSVTPFHTSTDWHCHTQYRSSHITRHALACDSLSTEILYGILFRFVRAATTVRHQYSLVPKTQLYCLEL